MSKYIVAVYPQYIEYEVNAPSKAVAEEIAMKRYSPVESDIHKAEAHAVCGECGEEYEPDNHIDQGFCDDCESEMSHCPNCQKVMEEVVDYKDKLVELHCDNCNTTEEV